MTRSKTKKLIRLSRSVHRWLGLVSLPLVMIIGITGYYLNHSTLVSSILPYSEDRGDMFTSPHPDGPREMAHLLVLMSTVWGRVPVHSIRTVDCDGFECLTLSQVDDSRRRISLGVESGDYHREKSIPEGQPGAGRLVDLLHDLLGLPARPTAYR